jgi:putative transcriptional regulator
MKKRNLFADISEGFVALADGRAGRLTLRTVEVEIKQAVEISASDLLALRERLRLSRPILAAYLRTNPRTLENWEQGRAKPNAQAALLIRLVEKFPDTVERIAALEAA